MSDIEMAAVRGGQPLFQGASEIWPPASRDAERLVAEVMASQDPGGFAGNDSPVRTALEQRFAQERGYDSAIACTNGTDAIALGLMGVWATRSQTWKAGRTKIIAPVFTWVPGTAGGARRATLETFERAPEFELVDARPEDWTPDEGEIIDALQRHGNQTLGIVMPSLLDTWAQLEPVIEAAAFYGVPVVSDGAQCGGGRQPGEVLADVDTESGQAGKARGYKSKESGLVAFKSQMAARAARQITDAGNLPGGVLDPLGGEPASLDLPPCPNMRLASPAAAAMLGVFDEAAARLPQIRRARLEIGTELLGPDEMVIFRTPPIQDWYVKCGPTYGFGMELTEEAEQRFGLNADQWHQFLAAEGLATWPSGAWKYGIRRPYPNAVADALWAGKVPGGRFYARAARIAERGLMVHVGNLSGRGVRLLRAAIAKGVGDAAGLRQHFGV